MSKHSKSARSLCKHQGCPKTACFGYKEDISYCNVHKLEGMVWTLTRQTIPTENSSAKNLAETSETVGKNESDGKNKRLWSDFMKNATKKTKLSSGAEKDTTANRVPETLVVLDIINPPDLKPSENSALPEFTLIKKGKHVYGIKAEYFSNPKFSAWLRYDKQSDRIFCSLCKKHYTLLETVSIVIDKMKSRFDLSTKNPVVQHTHILDTAAMPVLALDENGVPIPHDYGNEDIVAFVKHFKPFLERKGCVTATVIYEWQDVKEFVLQ